MEDMIKSRALHWKHITMKFNEFEYRAFKHLAIQFLEHFDQVVIDFHFDSLTDLWGHLDIIKSFNEEMVPVNVHSNNGGCFS